MCRLMLLSVSLIGLLWFICVYLLFFLWMVVLLCVSVIMWLRCGIFLNIVGKCVLSCMMCLLMNVVSVLFLLMLSVCVMLWLCS